MMDILKQKFRDSSCLAQQLMDTKGAFLLEHNNVVGRDAFWSNNSFGSGKNWLGALLMLRRSELLRQIRAENDEWALWLVDKVDMQTGHTSPAWNDIVQAATDCIVKELRQVDRPTGSTDAVSGQRCSTSTADAAGSHQSKFTQLSEPGTTAIRSSKVSKSAQWFWDAGEPGRPNEMPYESEANLKIEDAFQENKKGAYIFVPLSSGVGATMYRIDFAKMSATTPATSVQFVEKMENVVVTRSISFKCYRSQERTSSSKAPRVEARPATQWFWRDYFKQGEYTPYDAAANMKIATAYEVHDSFAGNAFFDQA
ncbi:unnamed protein product [Symbiodinium sp. CCMP2592]|nr:unnamed protein product [Symbiodinium sp. CCMP2592]